MKLHPPKAIIDPNEPFKHALFGRKDFADSLTGIIRNVTEGLVVFVNAPWGEGKTTFAEMWRTDLRRQKLEVIYFDAYAADYFDDPFVSFSGEILALAKAKRIAAPRSEFKKTAVEVGKRLAGLAVKVGLRAATLGAIDSTHVAEIKEISSDVASGVSELGAEIVEKKIENYSAEKDALKSFKESLAKLAKVIRDDQGFPLTIIVDELDRCRPDFALGLLERIKHLFDVEGVAFVLLVNRDQIESYVRSVYGENVDANAYLLKFANIFVDLPTQQPLFHHERGREDYCEILFAHHFSEGVRDRDFLARSLRSLLDRFDLTLREIEKVFTIMVLYYGSLPSNQITSGFLISMLAIFKVKHPSLYQRLSNAEISIDQFYKESGLDQLTKEHSGGVNSEWVKDTLNLCLMPDEEFEKATKNVDGTETNLGRMRFGYNIDRKKIIPYFCSRLDRFSLQPKS